MVQNIGDGYQLKFEYVVDGLQRKHNIWISIQGNPAIGADFGTIDILKSDGTSSSLQTWVDGYQDVVAAMYPPSVAFGNAQLWFAPQGLEGQTFISQSATASLGTAVGAVTLAGQRTLSCRTKDGGIAYFTLLECTSIGTNKRLLATRPTDVKDWGEYIVNQPTPVLGKDDSFVFAPLLVSESQNEKAFRQRYRK